MNKILSKLDQYLHSKSNLTSLSEKCLTVNKNANVVTPADHKIVLKAIITVHSCQHLS